MFNFDYDNQKLLQSCMDLLIKDSSVRSKIVSGRQGGLAYKLFNTKKWVNFPREDFIPLSVETIAGLTVNRYLNTLRDYIQSSMEHADYHGFKMVGYDINDISDRWKLTPGNIAIGDVKISSYQRIVDFAEMVEDAQGDLALQYEELREEAKNLFI